jgi:CRP-like cAMP-binding protein
MADTADEARACEARDGGSNGTADATRNGMRNGMRNRLLASLPAADYARLAPALERVDLTLKQIAFDVDRPIEHVYFPEGAVVSVVGVMADGTAVETATIGREGMVGLPVFLGTGQTSAQAFAQIAGPAMRMTAEAFRAAIDASPAFAGVLLRYTQALFTLVAQSSACNRVHTMTERCARWLLHCHDRVERDEFPLTHQFLSQMLGVRRATVTEAMGTLQERGVVDYQRGVVQVRDRAALEGVACECYAIIAREFDRLLGTSEASPASGASAAGPGPLDGVSTSEGGCSTLGDGAPPGPMGT